MSLEVLLAKMALRHNRSKTARAVKKVCRIKGKKFIVPRLGAKGVTVYIYHPEHDDAIGMPVVFNVHGGAWVGGDALLLDTQSQKMANRLNAIVVNINYVKVDEQPFPYAQYEVRDTVKYFSENYAEFGMDTSRFALMGYSAGGHLCACAAQLLIEDDIPLSCQVLCYPFLDFTYGGGSQSEIKETLDKLTLIDKVFFPMIPKTHYLCSPGQQNEEKLRGVAPAIIVTCGTDPLKVQGEAYTDRLLSAGVSVWQ